MSDQPARTVTLTDLLRIPSLRWMTVVAGAVTGLLLAIGYLVVAPPAASATAVVAVRPVVTDAFTYPGAGADRSVNMNVESGIAASTEVLSRIAEARSSDVVEVRRALEIEVPTGGQILRFTYSTGTVDDAVDTVNLAAATYLQVRQEMYERQRTDMLASYDESIVKVAEQQDAAQRRVANANSTPAADAALAEFGSLSNQLTELNAARTEIAAIDVTPGWITQSAQQQLSTDGPPGILYLLAGLLVGAVLGVLLTYLRESVDRRIRSEAEASEVAGLPLLGTVRRRGLRVDARTVDADVRYVGMAIAEQLRQAVRTPVVVISSRNREDTTPMTASLAVALAADGRDVYIGDDSHRVTALRDALLADRRRVPSGPFVPAQPGGGAPTPPGAAEQRSGDSGDPESTLIFSLPNVDQDHTVILPRVTDTADAPAGPARRPSPRPTPGTGQARPSGGDRAAAGDRPTGDGGPVVATIPVRTLPADALTVGAGMVRIGLYAQAPRDGEIVLFNAPPAESDERGVREARAGTAIVVVERDRTRLADLRRLTDRLRAAGAEPLGFVLTGSGRG
ncbi:MULTISPECIES: lipopolysaccharide biosynthesis protein [unclassified Solwaraspora]|uniref:lipopolysaccharide biosynthesis protein n=1 Tax=unclassified Solwaraspora TaxID=2627926 RepID=UPI00248B0930|nr:MULTISPECIES: lipopolysaccharide biosynthesis protein [unclassified Solwaraspora]WBB98202.1 lipopolysaccharide biosynthesis protein [Solwaraspora sp. WMMA2059]WBC23244.1 lipopolysaccharide biosynthesis protein [Solwaraspora sp. WMMA2080]WJK34672.1 lipopolysaccharide biosynthesis protein [Solwaraspora sp. WMMA2065]